jgi:hypothetical protein
MTLKDRINDEYFEWLCGMVDSKRYAKSVSYRKLLMRLHDIEFTYFVPYDDNRADDGVQLRRRFALIRDNMSIADYITGPCSVLEMMVALAVRCEETIMDDALMGDRTGQWFWGMVHNLGLSPMSDSKFNRHEVDAIVSRFLNREYEPNGKGGLFTVKHCARDMRNVEIWCQLSWYLDSIT